MEGEELQEADVMWPWPDTPPPSPEDGGEELYLPATELYEYGAAAVDVAFSCEPFSEAAPASSSSSLTLSAPWSDSSSGGFFLSGPSTVSAGLELDATEEFLEADVLWPDTADDSVEDAAAEFWWRCRCRRRLEEEAAAAAAAVCGTREGRKSSPIDIPMATTRVVAARRRPSPSAMPVHRRR
ncbi:hypothetical protein ACP70R_034071 [Stipagrostis hirtigluma subsp. patula]